MSTYLPTEGTLAARALDAIEKLSKDKPGAWVPNLAVSRALGVKPNTVRPSLDRFIESGLVERSLDTSGCARWRLSPLKSRRRAKPVVEREPSFGINWPPGFVSQYDTVKVASYEERRK